METIIKLKTSTIKGRTTMYICFFGTYDKTYTSNIMILKGLMQNGVKVLEVNAHTKVTKLTTNEEMSLFHLIRRTIRKFAIIGEIIKHFDELKKVDAIYVGYPGHVDIFFAYPIAKLLGKKLVFNPLLVIYNGFAYEQGILKPESFLAKIVKKTESLVYNLCDMVFADTKLQEDVFEKEFSIPKKKLRLLPIGADNKGYDYTPYTNSKKQIEITYYGLYSPIHGVEHIIETARLLKNDPSIHFTMVGNGNTFEANYKKAKSLKLSNITFYHDIPEKDHLAILQKGDIFLGFLQKHPSVDRIIPNKVYQGLALGKVVITADAPVSRGMFENTKNMILVEAANPKALAEKLVELKNKPLLRKAIAEAGHNLYKKHYTPKKVVRKMIDYISEIL